VKVYAAEVGAFGVREEHLLTMFAAQCATLLRHLRTAEDARRISDELKRTLHSRNVVAMAKGIMMARDGVTERTAFLLLADTAKDRGQTLVDTAQRLVRTATRSGG
jgi:AmiR/NasT family two-component response regulator